MTVAQPSGVHEVHVCAVLPWPSPVNSSFDHLSALSPFCTCHCANLSAFLPEWLSRFGPPHWPWLGF